MGKQVMPPRETILSTITLNLITLLLTSHENCPAQVLFKLLIVWNV